MLEFIKNNGKRKRGSRKIAMVLIAMAMIWNYFPLSTLAAEVSITDELELKTALTTGVDDIVKLDADITLSSTILLGTTTDYTLDLNGHTITVNVGGINYGMDIPVDASLTIINTGDVDGKIIRGATNQWAVLHNKGNLTIGNATMPDNGTSVIIDGGYEEGNGKTTTMALIYNTDMSAVFTLRTNGVLEKNNNNSQNPGGGVLVAAGEFYMTGGEIRNNIALNTGTQSTGRNGGGVFVSMGYFEMSGGKIHHNVANTRGGLLNLSRGSGGGVAIHADTTAHPEYGTYKASLFVMKGGIISDNTAIEGGGVWTSTADNTRFLMQGGIIENNTAEYGGGVMNSSTMRSETCAINNILTGLYLEAGEIRNNKATVSYGGGVYNSSASSNVRILSGMRIVGNTAVSGGGVSLHGSGDVSMLIDGAIIQDNTATTNGGGIEVEGRKTVTIKNMLEDTDTAIQGNQAANGGGVYLSGANGTYTMENVTLMDNTATTNGSGVYVSSGTTTISNSEIKENGKTTSGGGIYSSGTSFGPATLTLVGTTITKNAAVNGGGVYIANAYATIILDAQSSIVENTADLVGGGVYVNGGIFTMSDTGDVKTNPYIYKNIASQSLTEGSSADDVKMIDGTLNLLATEDMQLPDVDITGWFNDTSENRYRVSNDEDTDTTNDPSMHIVVTGTPITGDVDVTLGYSYYSVIYAPGDHGTFEQQTTEDLSLGDVTPTPPIVAGETGWRFVGWSPAISETVTGTITYVAQWERIMLTVTFVDFDGRVIKTQQVPYGDDATAPNNPTRDGYTFIGWDRTYNNVTENITVVAEYEPTDSSIPTTGDYSTSLLALLGISVLGILALHKKRKYE